MKILTKCKSNGNPAHHYHRLPLLPLYAPKRRSAPLLIRHVGSASAQFMREGKTFDDSPARPNVRLAIHLASMPDHHHQHVTEIDEMLLRRLALGAFAAAPF